MKLEWSDEALADLTRFAAFVEVTHPNLSERVAQAIIGRAELLIEYPLLGRPMAGREHYREIVLEVLNAQYVFQYWFDGTASSCSACFTGAKGVDYFAGASITTKSLALRVSGVAS